MTDRASAEREGFVEIADFLADMIRDMSSGFMPSDAVERQTSNLRKWESLCRSMCVPAAGASTDWHEDERTARMQDEVDRLRAQVERMTVALTKAVKHLNEIEEFSTNHKARPCGDYDAECPIQMGEWFSKDDREELAEIRASLLSTESDRHG